MELPPEPEPFPPPRPPSFCSVCGRYHPDPAAPARDHLCCHFPRVAALIIAASPRVAVLSVITGLIPRHVYAPYLLCKGEFFRLPFLIRRYSPPAQVLVYRGDASQRSAYAPASPRCRHPPSTLFYRLKLIKPAAQPAFLWRQSQRVLSYLTGKTFCQSPESSGTPIPA